MKIINSYFYNKVLLLEANKILDNRGFFFEIYNKKDFIKLKIKDNFLQDNISFSKKKYTFRGIHLQVKPFEQTKLIRVLSGSIVDYIVDLRINSKTYGNYVKIILSDKKLNLVYIPQGFAHGFLTLEKNTLIQYKVSNFYSKKHSCTIAYNDSYLKLDFIKKNYKLTLSKSDKHGITLKEYNKI